MLLKEKLGKIVTIRDKPAVGGNPVGSLAPYALVEADDALIADVYGNTWAKIDAGYVAYDYPPNGLRFEILGTPPPPDTYPVARITVFSDGSYAVEDIQPPE